MNLSLSSTTGSGYFIVSIFSHMHVNKGAGSLRRCPILRSRLRRLGDPKVFDLRGLLSGIWGG